MSQSYWDVQNNPKVHEGDIELDENIIAAGAIVKGCRGHGVSNWNTTAWIDVEIDEKLVSYFLKLAEGPGAGPMFKGEYESMKLINKTVPAFSPEPISWGKCKDTNRHVILFSFHTLHKGSPSIPRLVHAVAQLHTLSVDSNPTGKFGFHTNTYNGTLEQDNTWTDTWEEFYVRGMPHMLRLEEEARGPSDELKQLVGPFFDKVIPRLLRPLETCGRSVQPVLLHGDLWLGNVSVQDGSEEPLMFDASTFWGHHEYELATLRLVGNDWATDCLESYHRLIPKSEPQDDWDARNQLYSTRVIIHDSALYPEVPHFRETLVREMRKLVEQFPGGLAEQGAVDGRTGKGGCSS